MRENAYREDELLDAIIVDSEGYLYGRVEKVSIDEDKVTLLAGENKPDVKTIVDVASLKETLLKGVRKTLSSKLRREGTAVVLTNNIRKQLGLRLDEELNDGHYLKYAEKLDFPIPYVKAAAERTEEKGTIDLNEVRTMQITVLGKDKETRLIKAILLREPKEASFRRIPIQENVGYRNTNAVRDKLVLDAEGAALGYADSVVLFHDAPGIRVYVLRVSGQVNLNLLMRYLEETGQASVAALVKKHLVDKESNRYSLQTEELEDFMYQMKVAFRLPEKLITDRSFKEFVADIPWSFVHKIGDVILLNSTLSEFRSKGYL